MKISPKLSQMIEQAADREAVGSNLGENERKRIVNRFKEENPLAILPEDVHDAFNSIIYDRNTIQLAIG